MIDKTIILGHGPSMINSNNGKFIESHRYIIRFPYLGNWQKPEDFGTRCSHICSTAFRMRRRNHDYPDDGYFIWYKRTGMAEEEFGHLPRPVKDVTSLVKKWEKKLGRRATYPRLSHGSASTLIALEELGLPVVLIGCDMLKIGESDQRQYVGSYLYENRKQNKSHHDLKVERELISEMSEEYGIDVDFR